ncbi:multiheme c-type cytochrome [Methanococcoides sp. AM1]|uniref:multiheme c-type cytochrome n=1 Tax=Methanococcoides sp. AM1 TaxID=1201011 RepID=UPI001083C2B1|nr:multiheme c-type cytochrome [Methanococcoides sp. AM1]
MILLLFASFVLLIAGAAAAAEPTGFGELDSDDFVSQSKCANCHAIIRSQWEGSMHAYAYTDPLYQAELQMASEETGGQTDEFCSRCHTPIGVLGGEVPPIDGSMASDVALEGVQCDFCHTVPEGAGIGDGAFISSPGDVKWGPLDDAPSAFHESEFNEFYTEAEYCGMCHNVNSPFNGLPLDDTYTSWADSQYAEDEVTCQDCHMTPGITQFEANPGRSASSAPKRDHISIHEIVGGNSFMLDVLSDGMYGEKAVERLQKAATLEVSVPNEAASGEEIIIDVSITNSGAGHKLPTGITEVRQMWLEVSVTDADGKQLYNSGQLDDEGNIEDAVIYHTVLADAEGQVTDKLWEAESIVSDNRILPKGTEVESHSFVMPEDSVDPILVEAKLLYRSAPQDMVDELFGEGTYDVPVVDMVNAYGSINGEADIPSEPTPGFGGILLVISMIAVACIYRTKK